jgi:DNA-binding response OmpR family regulator
VTQRILVADDSDNIRNVLQLNFEWRGYEVLAAADGEEAVRLVERSRPDLIILDVMMPRRNGFQVCRQVKSDARTADIPVILLTAKNQKEDMFWGRDCGADEYITKPFNTPTLEKVVERLLERARSDPGQSVSDSEVGLQESLNEAIREGNACGVGTLRLDPTPLMVHRQKYGELRHRQVFDAALRAIREVLQREHREAEPEEDQGSFRVLITATADRVRDILERIVERANELIQDCYDEADRSQGYVMSRDFHSGGEVRTPLVTLRVEGTQLYNQD